MEYTTLPCPGCGVHSDVRVESVSKDLGGSGADIRLWCMCGVTSELRLDVIEGLPFLALRAVEGTEGMDGLLKSDP